MSSLITAAEQLRAISQACRTLGDGALMNRTRAAIRVETAPLTRDALPAAARARLPKSGGLNEQVAGKKWSTHSLAGARVAGVRIRTTAPDTGTTNDGYVLHPTFGRRGKGQWRRQEIPGAAGWADDTVEKYGPVVAAGIMRELDLAAAEIARAGGGV